MNNQTITILILLIFVSACREMTDENQYTITDKTKIRPFDSTLTDYPNSPSLGQIQKDYNEEKMEQFRNLLKNLDLLSLREYSIDTTAYRLIIDFGWGSRWSGSPLALTIFKTGDSATVESVELKYRNSDSRSTDFHNPVRQQLNYKVEFRQFRDLDSIFFNEQDLWQDFSFEANDGWVIFDNDEFFIEARKGTKYKFLVREKGESYYEELLLPFLKATNYNDTIVTELEKFYK